MYVMYRMSDELQKLVTDVKESDKKPSGTIALIIICITFIIPMGLWFSMVFNTSGGMVNSALLFLGIYGFSFLITLMYYRMVIQDDMEAKIDKITVGKVKSIATTTLAAFSIVVITIFMLNVNPELITIFENSIGLWFIGISGNKYFANEIFHSKTFSELKEYTEDKSIFDQSFLLTCFNNDNIDHFIKYFKKDCSKSEIEEAGVSLPFDFIPKFKNEGHLNKLRELVSLKHLVGYFSWIYFTSLISLIISIIAVAMKTI
jgi:hypothetical protein